MPLPFHDTRPFAARTRIARASVSRACLAVACAATLAACGSDGATDVPIDTTSGGGTPLPPGTPVLRAQVLSFNGLPILKPGAQSYRAGSSIGLYAEAELAGQGRITWLGVHVTTPVDVRDSVAVPDSLGRELVAQFTLTPPADYTGSVAVRMFARTSEGKLAELELAGSPATMYREVARPVRFVTMPELTTEARLDPTRDRLYFPQPAARTVAVLDLATFTLGEPIAMPDTVTSLDVTTDGATLVGVMPARRQLVLVDLRQPVPTVTGVVDLTMPEPVVPDLPYFPTRVRVAANGRALVTLGFRGSGATPLLEYDLAAATQRVRTAPAAIDPARIVGTDARMERALTGERVAIFLNYLCCAPAMRVYTSATDDISALAGNTDAGFDPTVTLDSAGTRVLLGQALFDGALRPIADYHAPAEMRASALSLDGGTIFARNATGSRMGVIRLDAATGAVQEEIPLGYVPVRFFPRPGRAELLTITGAGRIGLIDLAHVSTGPSAVRAPGAATGGAFRVTMTGLAAPRPSTRCAAGTVGGGSPDCAP